MQAVAAVVPYEAQQRLECAFSPMYLLYSALLAAGLLLSLPYWILEGVRHGKYSAGLRERLGRVPKRLARDSSHATIWIHAVSVGEVVAVSGLVQELRRSFPEHRVVVSTTTDTGQKMAGSKFGEENVFYFPLDFSFAIRPFLNLLQPKLIVIAETEFWPNFLRLAHESGARVAVVNARISDKSHGGYLRFGPLLRRVLQNIDLFLAQTEADAQRLREIGAPADRIHVSGNLKFDVPMPATPPIVANLREVFRSFASGPILVCGSTVEGEEPLLLRAFEIVLASYPGTVMILAPRHPERFGKVAELLQRLNIRFWRRSTWNGDAIRSGVLLCDTIGELAALYALADIAFVGGSLVPRGGHNIIEPARHGVAIVVGHHTENFRDIVALFQSRDAVRVVRPEELPLAFMQLLANSEERKALGARAAETLRLQTGATQRTADALSTVLAQSTKIAAGRNE
jgi:3-deoxy-D-manno-octulosonic-acid transferase